MPDAAIFLCAVALAAFVSRHMFVRNKEKAGAFVLLVLVAAVFFFPLSLFAGDKAETAPGRASGQRVAAASQGFVLAAAQDAAGQPRPEPTPQPAASERPKWVEKYFKGSFLGSFFLGYPYSGVGAPDGVVMAVAALLALRLISSKLRSRRNHYALPRDGGNRANMQRFDASWAGRNKAAQPLQLEDDYRTMSEARPMGSSQAVGADRAGGPADYSDRDAVFDELRSMEAAPSVSRDGAFSGSEPVVPEDGPGYGQDVREQEDLADVYLGQWASIAGHVVLPPGFDAEYFLEWSRSIYATLQYAWADRQVDALAPYVSREMFYVLKSQAVKSPSPVQVEIQYVHSRLTEILHDDHWAQVSIGFTVSMSSGFEGRPVEIRETWRFVCGGDDGSWRVEAIEQA